MPDYTVTRITNEKAWPDSDNPQVIYYDFEAEGVDKVCNIGRKPGNPLKVGERFEAEVKEEKNGRLNLKRVQQQRGFGGGGRSPEENARIQRQHSQEMCLRFLALKVQMGELPSEAFKDIKPADLRPIINWFDEDASNAKPPAPPLPRRDVERTGGSDITSAAQLEQMDRESRERAVAAREMSGVIQ